ncbi:MAG: di-trans,poly-cis-decaprenylcistransferase [Candidatus Aenigmatarchaeota archaeon]|nr:MAG: di-trans,poly-cis-decaprenylcistransferase [Candidatus Aenigmarchaeota archaeon]
MTDDVKSRKSGIHIGLIPDGNRRYAVEKGINVLEGHRLGAKKIEEFLEWCDEYPEIRMVSIFALSTENLNRSRTEVNALWRVYRDELKKLLKHPSVKKKKMRVRVLGERGVWRPDIKDIVKELYDSTKSYSRTFLNIMLAYGSKLEINEAVKEVIRKPFEKLDKALYVKEPLDLVIRTGKQHRLSNFMLYQASYAEIYFCDKLWPDFTRKDFDHIMRWYHEQQRKFGQ